MNQTFNYPTWFFVCFVLSKFIFFLYFDMGGCNYKTSNMTALWVKLYGFRGQPWYKQKTSHILKSNIRKIGHQALLKASVFTRITCFLTHTSCPPLALKPIAMTVLWSKARHQRRSRQEWHIRPRSRQEWHIRTRGAREIRNNLFILWWWSYLNHYLVSAFPFCNCIFIHHWSLFRLDRILIARLCLKNNIAVHCP